LKSKDYHDYVFRNGKLVGQFEEMYLHSESIPWHQDEQENWVDVRLTKEMIRNLGKFSEIYDLGCGTGHYLALISDYCLGVGGKCYGFDVSEAACNKAATFFPQITFAPMDLMVRSVAFNHYDKKIDKGQNQSRLFIIRATLWYVYPKLVTVIDNIHSFMTDGDRLLVVQNFPPLETSFIGKEVIPNHHTLILQFTRLFAIDQHIWYEDHNRSENDNWFIGVFTKKD
jgi:hypothetical protein